MIEKDNLEKFAQGDVAIWRYMDDTRPTKQSDCAKLIESTNGLITFQYVKDEKLVSYQFWGGNTTHAKFFDDELQSRRIVGRDGGKITYFKLNNKKREDKSLTLTAVRDDGLISENFFSMSDNGSLQTNGWRYLNPSATDARNYEALKKYILTTTEVETCKLSTLLEHVKKTEDLNKQLPDSHLYLGSRLIDLVPEDPTITDPRKFSKEFYECRFISENYKRPQLLTANSCIFEKIGVGFKLKADEFLSLTAAAPNCCLNFVEISTNRISFDDHLDVFKGLPGVEKISVNCEKSESSYGSHTFYEIKKNGQPKFSIREISDGGTGGYGVTTTVYFGMPKINCKEIIRLDEVYDN